MRVLQLFNGLGSGNLGDELMALGLWAHWRPNSLTTIEYWPESHPHKYYPKKANYTPWPGSAGYQDKISDFDLILLAGDTPVNEMLGLEWPLQSLEGPLLAAHQAQVPVVAIGVGVDLLKSEAALKIFAQAYLPIKTWSVRSPACRAALVKMGVNRHKITLAADLAWLHRPQRLQIKARSWLIANGVNPDIPFLAVNVVHEKWGENHDFQVSIARALDEFVGKSGWPVVFIANEIRSGNFYDCAAGMRLHRLMQEKSFLLPTQKCHPDLIISILELAAGVVAQRYHFAIEAILAGQRPVVFQRGQKMTGLINELHLPCCGKMGEILAPERLYNQIKKARRPQAMLHQKWLVAQMRHRAAENMNLLQNRL